MKAHSKMLNIIYQTASSFLLLFAADSLFSNESTTYSTGRLNSFYDQFACEEKDVTAGVDLTPYCSGSSPALSDSCGTILNPPTIPALAQAAVSTDYIPFVLVNNTGLDDDAVYFVIYGKQVTGCNSSGPVIGNYSFVSFGAQPGPFTATGATGGSAEATGSNTPPSATYSYKFSDIPLSNGQRIVYIPNLDAGVVLFSIDAALDLTVENNSIAVPVATDPIDLAYFTVYGGMEVTFYPANCPQSSPENQLTIDLSCVDYYGLSIYMNLYTENPLPGLPKNRPSGIYQSRHHTLCILQQVLAQAYPAALSTWQGLIQTDGDKILRVVSPGYSMSHADAGGTFDTNYLNNAATYGFSWAEDAWIGSGAYYIDNQLSTVTTDGTPYVGQVTDQVFIFKNQTKKSKEQFGIPWTDVPVAPTNFNTSTAIFNVSAYFPNMTYSNDSGVTTCIITDGGCSVPSDALVRANQLTKFFSASIAAGLLPGKVNKMLPNGYPPSVINSYYTPNSNLNPPGPTTGPWFDLYSLGIFYNSSVTGNAVYTYAYDDYLYSQSVQTAQVAPSQLTIDSSTYVTIVLGPYTDN